MKKITLIAVIMFSLILLANCSRKQTTENTEAGDILITVNLQPVLHHYLPVTRVTAQAFVPDSRRVYELEIDSTFATGVIPNLETGVYLILVNVYSDTLLVASGTNTGTVTEDEDAAVQIEPEMSSAVNNRVLLVGNSHTYYNQGVDLHIRQLIAGCFGATVSACTQGGYSLQNHFNDPNTINTIRNGNWDLVFLQENSQYPVEQTELFYEYAAKLDTVIRQCGARTGLYMTWAWENNPEMYEPVVNAYNTIGAELGAVVAPCGIAFHNALQINPLLELYDADTSHASLNGTFLASCVIYATIWNYNPVNSSYVPAGIDSTTAVFLKQTAWNTVQEYQASRELRTLERMMDGLPKAIAYREQERLLKAE